MDRPSQPSRAGRTRLSLGFCRNVLNGGREGGRSRPWRGAGRGVLPAWCRRAAASLKTLPYGLLPVSLHRLRLASLGRRGTDRPGSSSALWPCTGAVPRRGLPAAAERQRQKRTKAVCSPGAGPRLNFKFGNHGCRLASRPRGDYHGRRTRRRPARRGTQRSAASRERSGASVAHCRTAVVPPWHRPVAVRDATASSATAAARLSLPTGPPASPRHHAPGRTGPGPGTTACHQRSRATKCNHCMSECTFARNCCRRGLGVRWLAGVAEDPHIFRQLYGVATTLSLFAQRVGGGGEGGSHDALCACPQSALALFAGTAESQ